MWEVVFNPGFASAAWPAAAADATENAPAILPIILAVLLAAALAVAWRASGRDGSFVLCVLWGAYAVYEFLMFRRVLCSGECNIRVDLLLIVPALLGSTLWVSLAAIRARRRRPARSELPGA